MIIPSKQQAAGDHRRRGEKERCRAERRDDKEDLLPARRGVGPQCIRERTIECRDHPPCHHFLRNDDEPHDRRRGDQSQDQVQRHIARRNYDMCTS
jgi:hypothetical protein